MAERVKRLVDGVVSALHFDPTPAADAVGRVALGLDVDAAEVRELMAAPLGPMGPRRVVWNFGASGVQWNPDDGRLVVILVRQGDGLPFAVRVSRAVAL